MNNREQVETTSVVSQVQGISFESSDNNQAATPLDNHYQFQLLMS
jgi:hypothetical protein